MKTAKVIVGSESSKGASMMMSKGTLMAEKTRQMKSDSGITGIKGLPPPLANPGVPGITAPKTETPGLRQRPKLGPAVVDDDEDSDAEMGGPKNATTATDIDSETLVPLSPLPIE